MKAVGRVIALVLLGLLVVVNSGQAVTIDSLLRSVQAGPEVQSSNLGTFSQGSSWPGSTYDEGWGTQWPGVSAFQDTSVVNNVAAMEVSGGGSLHMWYATPVPYIPWSRLSILFTPLTAASYSFDNNCDGGMVTFKDTVTSLYLDMATGILIEGRQYQVEAFTTSTVTYGNYGEYWSLQLTVEEHPAPVPLPGSLLLLGPGLIGLVGLKRRFTK